VKKGVNRLLDWWYFPAALKALTYLFVAYQISLTNAPFATLLGCSVKQEYFLTPSHQVLKLVFNQLNRNLFPLEKKLCNNQPEITANLSHIHHFSKEKHGSVEKPQLRTIFSCQSWCPASN
jgi:hypothetical protein